MNTQDLRTLVDYNYWANGRLTDAVALLTPEQYTRSIESSFKSVRDTMVHLYGAEVIWTARLYGEPPIGLPKADGFPDVATLRNAWADAESRLRTFVNELDDARLKFVMEFTSLNFGKASSSVEVAVQQVVNHAGYHRGQVVTMLHQLGAARPKGMDLSLYHRDVGQK